MRFYALPKVDGGVFVLQVVDDATDPAKEIAKLHPNKRAAFTGAIHEIAEADYRAMPTKGPRGSWKFDNGKLEIDAAKKAEIEARPAPLTIEQRIAALEARR
jgi:hypothetical protein